MKTIFLKKVTNILLFGFLTSTYVYAGSEPRNGPDLSGISIPVKFDKAITETALFKVNTMCLNKYIIYTLLQKISTNSNESLRINDFKVETPLFGLQTFAYPHILNETNEVELITKKENYVLFNTSHPPLYLKLNGYTHQLNEFSFFSGINQESGVGQLVTIKALPIEFQGSEVTKQLTLKLPVIKYEIAYSEADDEFGEKTNVPRIKNLRIEGTFSEAHPLYNYSTKKAASFTLNTKEYVNCIKNGIAGD